MKKLSESEFLRLKEEGVLLVDTREIDCSAELFFIDSLSISLGADFIDTFQNLISPDRKVVLLCQETEWAVLNSLISGSGFRGLMGYVIPQELAHLPKSVIITVDANEFALDYHYDEFYLVDVRLQEDYEKEHIEFSENIPIDDLETLCQDIPENARIYVVGKNARQAFTAASLLKLNGFEFTRVVCCHFDELRQKGIPMVKRTTQPHTTDN
jgi:hydroxyacylglutathione hydrolase